jgi:hypothetical protein
LSGKTPKTKHQISTMIQTPKLNDTVGGTKFLILQNSGIPTNIAPFADGY